MKKLLSLSHFKWDLLAQLVQMRTSAVLRELDLTIFSTIR